MSNDRWIHHPAYFDAFRQAEDRAKREGATMWIVGLEAIGPMPPAIAVRSAEEYDPNAYGQTLLATVNKYGAIYSGPKADL